LYLIADISMYELKPSEMCQMCYGSYPYEIIHSNAGLHFHRYSVTQRQKPVHTIYHLLPGKGKFRSCKVTYITIF